jgi:hypothetical protein
VARDLPSEEPGAPGAPQRTGAALHTDPSRAAFARHPLYDLRGVVVHQGRGIDRGHYFAHAWDPASEGADRAWRRERRRAHVARLRAQWAVAAAAARTIVAGVAQAPDEAGLGADVGAALEAGRGPVGEGEGWGDYEAPASDARGTWLCFNDHRVTVESSREVAAAQSFLLFYECV